MAGSNSLLPRAVLPKRSPANLSKAGPDLAMLNVMEATDFHYENLIAAGEHPVLIDLESALSPAQRVH